MLPTITWGGQEFYDISGVVTSDAQMGGIRPTTDGIAGHHSVSQTEFPDRNMNGTSLDEIVQHLKNIDAFHVQQGYGGFGYNGAIARDGTVLTVGKAAGKRAHVAHENWHLAGFVWLGNFETNQVPVGITLGMGRILAAMEKEYGVVHFQGHNEWVQPQNRPQWSTACCGRFGRQAIPQMFLVKEAINANLSKVLDGEVRRKIAEALRENADKGDVEALANQIKYITGGRLC